MRPELDDKPVVGCFRSLAMGTSYAVETAQHAHTVLLRRASCLKSSEQVAYKHPIPRGPRYELLCVDDHAYLLLVSKLEARKVPDVNRADMLHIIGLICRRVVAYFHIAPRCRSFGNS